MILCTVYCWEPTFSQTPLLHCKVQKGRELAFDLLNFNTSKKFYVCWIKVTESLSNRCAEIHVRKVRPFPNSNTCSPFSPLALGKKSNTLSHVSTFVLKKDFFLQALSKSVITHMCVYACKEKRKIMPKGAQHLKGLLRVFGEEGSPKLEHAHNIFGLLSPPLFLLSPLPFSKIKTSPETPPMHLNQPSVPPFHPCTLTLKEQHISVNDTGSGRTSEFTAKFIHL